MSHNYDCSCRCEECCLFENNLSACIEDEKQKTIDKSVVDNIGKKKAAKDFSFECLRWANQSGIDEDIDYDAQA